MSLTNTVTSASPYVTVNQPVNAEVTTKMTLDGAPVQTCVAVVSMPPNGGGSTQCSASYYVAPSQNPRTYVVRAEAVAIARALFQADVDGMLADLAEQEARLARSRTYRCDIPGGDLSAYEGEGTLDGHTIRDHIGCTDQSMVGRALRSPQRAQSSYPDIDLAHDTIAAALAVNERKIADWLAGNRPDLQLYYNSETGAVTGRRVARGSSTVTEVTGAIVRLVRSERGGDFGYIICTSFPFP